VLATQFPVRGRRTIRSGAGRSTPRECDCPILGTRLDGESPRTRHHLLRAVLSSASPRKGIAVVFARTTESQGVLIFAASLRGGKSPRH